MNPIEQALTQAAIAFMTEQAKAFLANPESFMQIFNLLQGCHNAVDVAQDALDAYDHGHLTRQQALEIVQICLQKDAAAKGKPIDIKAKRIEIEQLFNDR